MKNEQTRAAETAVAAFEAFTTNTKAAFDGRVAVAQATAQRGEWAQADRVVAAWDEYNDAVAGLLGGDSELARLVLDAIVPAAADLCVAWDDSPARLAEREVVLRHLLGDQYDEMARGGVQ